MIFNSHHNPYIGSCVHLLSMGHKNVRNYTFAEKQTIRKNYNKIPIEELCKLLPTRTKHSIQAKAILMKVTKPLNHWTKGDQSKLRKLWQKVPRETLCKAFPDRSWLGIHQEAAKALKLTRGNMALKPVAPLPLLTEGEKGYIAGYLDGEGTITLLWKKSREGHGYSPMVLFTNTNQESMEWIRAKIGGNLIVFKKVRDNKKWRTLYTLRTGSVLHIQQLLKMLLPYLIIKRKHAELMLEFCNSRANGSSGRNHGYTSTDIDIFNRFAELRRERRLAGLVSQL